MNSIDSHTIVVGIDGSANSDAALDWAVDAASREGLRLHLFSAGVHWPQDRDSDGSDGFVDAAIAREALRNAEQNLIRAKSRALVLAPGLAVSTHSGLESAARSLVAYSSQAHSIVVGRSGHNAWTGALLGAVATKVVNRAKCPVAVVHVPIRAASPPKGVAVAIDGSPLSELALELGFHYASVRGVDLRVIHASWTRATMNNTPDTRDDQLVQESLLISEAMVGWAERYPDVTVRVSKPVGPTVLSITEVAREAELLVMATSRHRLRRLILGSVSRGVLAHAPCTVLVVPNQTGHPRTSMTSNSAREARSSTP